MNNEATLQRVLESYAAETPEGNDNETLKKWMSRYPEYANDLMDFAAERAHMSHLPDAESDEGELERFLEHGRQKFRQLLNTSKKKPSEISSLIGSAEEAGLDRSAFAKAVGLSISLVIYLEKRRVRAASVPSKVINGIAAAIGASAEAVRAYLELPEMAAGLNYKAEERPAEIGPKDFAEAVEQDQTLTPEEKKALLSDTD